MFSAHYYLHLYLCETERNSIYIDVGHNESLIELHSCSPRALESYYVADLKNAWVYVINTYILECGNEIEIAAANFVAPDHIYSHISDGLQQEGMGTKMWHVCWF